MGVIDFAIDYWSNPGSLGGPIIVAVLAGMLLSFSTLVHSIKVPWIDSLLATAVATAGALVVLIFYIPIAVSDVAEQIYDARFWMGVGFWMVPAWPIVWLMAKVLRNWQRRKSNSRRTGIFQ